VNVSLNQGLNAAGRTSLDAHAANTVNIELNPGFSSNGDQATAAHEGVHAGEIMPGKISLAQAYSYEHDAFEAESYFSRAIGYEDTMYNPASVVGTYNGEPVYDPSKNIQIWNPSRTAADAETLRSSGVDAAAKVGANFDCANANGGCQ
jgi:hypothetical protein